MSQNAPADDRPSRRPLVWWGAGVLILGLVIGAVGGAGLVSRVGGDLARAFTADPVLTPVHMEIELHEGTYLVYQLTATSRSVGPVTTTNGQGVTIAVSDVTVTAPDGSTVVSESPRFTETLTRGSSTYTGAVTFETETEGRYRIGVTTPGAQVIVAPSIGSMFIGSLPWIALLALSGVVVLVGVVLLVVGLIRGRPTATVAASGPPAQVTTPAGWYADPQGQAALRWWDGQTWTGHVH